MNRRNISAFISYIFLFCLPFQLGKHFFPDYTLLSGIRIDYLSPTIYLTDILALLVIFINYKAILPWLSVHKLKYPFIFIIINVFFALSFPVAVYKWLKILELLALFVVFKSQKLSEKYVLIAFVAGAAFELFLGILQLSLKHSVQGFFYFFGERLLTLSTPDVAKSAINGFEFLRAYGTFSHPNSLGGFYALLYTFFLTFKTKHRLLKYTLLFLCFALTLLSFSKVAIVALAIVNIWYVLRERKNIDCLFCVISRVIVVAVLAGLVFFAHGDPLTVKKRWDLVQNALSIIIDHPFFGIGAGNYIIAHHRFPIYYPYFFLQPVHNIFLLLIAEMGVLVWLYISPFLWFIFHHIRSVTFWSCAFIVIFTGMFDHYWYTLQQNWLLLAVIFAYSSMTVKPPKSVLRTSL